MCLNQATQYQMIKFCGSYCFLVKYMFVHAFGILLVDTHTVFYCKTCATSEFPVRTEHSWGSESGNQISHQLFTDTTEWSPDCPCKMPWVAGWSLTMKTQILIDQSVSGWVRPADRTVLREGGPSPLSIPVRAFEQVCTLYYPQKTVQITFSRTSIKLVPKISLLYDDYGCQVLKYRKWCESHLRTTYRGRPSDI